LVGLYGEDARIFLLNCLVKDIDFRDPRNQNRDALKIQLLTHEIAQASSRPNFTTFICEVRAYFVHFLEQILATIVH
jgi:CCR4-NOT transcription complex subunit 1